MSSHPNTFQSFSDSDDDKDALREAFNARFQTTITDNKVISAMLGTPRVKDWYVSYRHQRSLEQRLPSHFSDLGLTAEEYARLLPAITLRRETKASALARTSEIMRSAREQCLRITSECESKLLSSASPLLLACTGGFNELEVSEQIRITEARFGRSDADFEAIEKEVLHIARQRWFAAARSGKNPF